MFYVAFRKYFPYIKFQCLIHLCFLLIISAHFKIFVFYRLELILFKRHQSQFKHCHCFWKIDIHPTSNGRCRRGGGVWGPGVETPLFWQTVHLNGQYIWMKTYSKNPLLYPGLGTPFKMAGSAPDISCNWCIWSIFTNSKKISPRSIMHWYKKICKPTYQHHIQQL